LSDTRKNEWYIPPVLPPRAPQISPQFAFALKVTAFGARFGLTTSIALVAAELASQLVDRHPAFAFGIAGSTSAILSWRLLGRFVRRLARDL